VQVYLRGVFLLVGLSSNQLIKKLIKDWKVVRMKQEQMTYELELICVNCRSIDNYSINCGSTVESYCKNARCTCCECIGFLKLEEED